MKLLPLLPAFVAAWVVGTMPTARAQTALPDATSVVQCTADDGSPVGGTNGCAVDHSTASVTMAPAVTLTASAGYVGGAPASSGGFAVLNYNFAVLGGAQDTVVPVNIDFALQALTFSAGPSPVYAFAEILANTPLSGVGAVICNTGCSSSSSTAAGTLHVNVYAGEAYGNTVTLEIEALAAGYADILANSATAYADPRIYVDPSFANAGAYSIALSDGVGNGMAAPVPEPSSLVLMLGGIGLVGCAAWRRMRPS